MCDTVLCIIIPLGIKQLPVAESLFMSGCDNFIFKHTPLTSFNFFLYALSHGPDNFVITNLYRLCRVKRAYFYLLKLGCAIGRCPRQPLTCSWAALGVLLQGSDVRRYTICYAPGAVYIRKHSLYFCAFDFL